MLLPLPMLVPAPLPALTGSLCAAGLVLLGWWWLWPGPALVSRIAPYLGGARPRLPHRIIRMVLRGAEKFGSTHASVTGRLHRLGEGDVADFRFAQLRAGVLAGAAGIALGLACLARGLPAPCSSSLVPSSPWTLSSPHACAAATALSPPNFLISPTS